MTFKTKYYMTHMEADRERCPLYCIVDGCWVCGVYVANQIVFNQTVINRDDAEFRNPKPSAAPMFPTALTSSLILLLLF